MPYYLSYVAEYSISDLTHQHASVALTYQAPGKLPEVVCRVGLYETNQVKIEKDLDAQKLGPLSRFMHKTYPITQEEAEKFLGKINNDRRIGDETTQKIQEEVNGFLKKHDVTWNDINTVLLGLNFPKTAPREMRISARQTAVYDFLNKRGKPAAKEEISRFLSSFYKLNTRTEFKDERKPQRQSTPGGPAYDFYRFNCKSYALSVMREVGVVDASLSNWGIDNPKASEGLKPLDLENGVKWRKPIALSKRLEKDAFEHATEAEMNEIGLQIRTNDLGNFLEEVRPLVNNPALNAIAGINEFRLAVSTDEISKVTKDKSQVQKLISCQNHLKQAVETFSKKVDYGIGTRLVDCFKRALNFLGASFALSPEHKATAITTLFDSISQEHALKTKDTLKFAAAKEEADLLRKSIEEGKALVNEWFVRLRHEKAKNQQHSSESTPEELEASGALTRLNDMLQWLENSKEAKEDIEKILEEKKHLDGFKESLTKRLKELRESQPDLNSLKDKSEPTPVIMSHDIHHHSPESSQDENEKEGSSKPHP